MNMPSDLYGHTQHVIFLVEALFAAILCVLLVAFGFACRDAYKSYLAWKVPPAATAAQKRAAYAKSRREWSKLHPAVDSKGKDNG